MIGLSAVVPATDAPPTLERCLDAIRGAAGPPEELIVIEEPARAGPARARNYGAARATGDVLVFVDADVVVSPGAFARIRAAFDADPELVGLFGSYDDAPTAPGAVSAFRNLLHHHVHQDAPGQATTFWAGLGAVRRDAFLAAGGFDADRYAVASVEDIELGMRLTERGAKLVLDPGLQGTHLKAWTVGSVVRTDFERRGVPWIVLLLERRGSATALNLGWRHRLTALAVLAGAGAVVARRPAVALGAATAVVALNRSFYGLLLRRMGVGGAAAGLALHALHHLVAAAAVPAGVGVHLAGRRRSRPRR